MISARLVDCHSKDCKECEGRRAKMEMLYKIPLSPDHLDEITARDMLFDQLYDDCCKCITSPVSTPPRFVIAQCSLEDVLARPDFFNVNNLGERPENYEEELARSQTKNWVHLFHTDVPVIKLDEEDIRWIKKSALTIGMLTGRFSRIYDEELDKTCAKHAKAFSEIPARAEGWFIRTERVSLKGGMHGAGPYGPFSSDSPQRALRGGFREIIESICSSNPGHEAIKENDQDLTIYFLPWISSVSDYEFRVFVYQNQITAISDQHLYTENQWLGKKLENEIVELGQKIVKHFQKSIRHKLKPMGGTYTMDFSLIDGVSPYFIECNSFGAQYAAGSALFNWIKDDQILRSNGTSVELRYVHPDSFNE
jgi:hypothetical protein